MRKLKYENFDVIFLHEHEASNRNYIKKIYNNLSKKTLLFYYSELSENKIKIKNIIKHNLQLNTEIIHARKCEIKEIFNVRVKNIFLKENHFQGSDKSTIIFGAFNDNKLVSIMTFDSKRQMNSGAENNTYELTRFAVINGTIIKGIFSRLLKQFIKTYKPQKVISFADKRFSDKSNNIYKANKFKLTKTLPFNYYYYNENYSNKILHKFNFGKKSIKTKFPEIFSNEKTESEMMNEMNFIKIWDFGKYKYELELDNNQNIIYGFIYKILNNINGKVYIGQTTRNLTKRIYEYKKALIYDNFYNQHLKNAFIKYGWENFEFSVIDTAQTLDELNHKEIKYIVNYQSLDKTKGYNIQSGGRNAIPDTSTLGKMSKSHIGIKQTEEWINKRIAKAGSDDAKKYGKIKTDEEKEFLSKNSPKYWKGKKRDDSTKAKISQTKKKNGLSEKQKKKLQKEVFVKNINNNNDIKTYKSTKHASLIMGVNQSTISRWCKNNKIINDYLWTYNI